MDFEITGRGVDVLLGCFGGRGDHCIPFPGEPGAEAAESEDGNRIYNIQEPGYRLLEC